MRLAVRPILRALIVSMAVVILQVVSTVVATPEAQAQGAYRIMLAGDSITHGSSGDYTWRYRLWNKLASTAPGAVSFVGPRTDLFDNVNNVSGSPHYADPGFAARAHAAMWGTTYGVQIPNIQDQIASTGANVLVVQLGTNDLSFETSPASTIVNVETYIGRARAANPTISIVVGQVFNRYDPWSGTYPLTNEVNDYNARLPALAARLNRANARVVIAPTADGWNAAAYTWDGTHPNPSGEAHIAQRMSQALASIGVGSSGPDIRQNLPWVVAGPVPGLQAGSEAATVSWNRTPTGSSGMFIEQRLVNTNEPWNRLPYAVPGESFTSGLLAAGGTYEFRLVPSNGFSTGIPGGSDRTAVSGPTPGAVARVDVSPPRSGIFDASTILASWPAGGNAGGYVMTTRFASNASQNAWQDLPYPLPADRTSWNFEILPAGRYMQMGVRTVRGFLSASTTPSVTQRTLGQPPIE